MKRTRERRLHNVRTVNHKVQNINKEEIKTAMKRMKN